MIDLLRYILFDGAIVRAVLVMSLTGSVLAILLFALKPLLQKWLSKAAQYYLWVVTVAALLVPVSVLVVLPGHTAAPIPAAPIQKLVSQAIVTAEEEKDFNLTNIPAEVIEEAERENKWISFSTSGQALAVSRFVFAYPFGTLIILLYYIVSFRVFTGFIRRRNQPVNAEELAVLTDILGSRRTPALYRNPLASTPMLIGLFKPAIILPDRIYTDAQLRAVLLHETTHLRRKDVFVRWLSVIACSVHWFNPIVWIMRREIDRACELSCDETVIRDLDANGKQNYGDTLIYVAADRKVSRAVLSTTMCEEKKDLKIRLESIMRSKKRTKLTIMVSAALIVAAVGIAVVLGARSGGADSSIFSDSPNSYDWASFDFPGQNYDSVFFLCNDAPYNPEYISINAQLMNNQNVTGLFCGESFTLVKLIGDSWRIVPFVNNISFNAIAHLLPDKESYSFSLTPDMLAVKLDEGQYRIVTDVYQQVTDETPPEKYMVWADFTIDKDAPKQETFEVPSGFIGNLDGKPMTLDDVRELAAKGDGLLFEELRQYRGMNVSSNFDRYIMVYGIEGGYRLVVHSDATGKPDSVNLESIWESGGSGIDIRHNDVDAFLQANPLQDSITEDQALNIAQTSLELELELVSWYILGDWPERTDSGAVFARALLDSTDTLSEPCWVLRVKDTSEWGGQYYAVGKKSGAIYIHKLTGGGNSIWNAHVSE